MKSFAFIFARGGSKGLPGKNIKKLAGKPLLQYSLEIAQACQKIEKVFVSTDDKNIAKVALENNAILIERPEELASDNSPEWASWRHAIEWAKKHYGEFENFVSLPVTSPLRSVEDVNAAIEKRLASSTDICISITLSNRSPYFNMVKISNNELIELVNQPRGNITRRQDAPKVFDITTVVYVADPDFIMKKHNIFSGKVSAIEVPKERAVDIDDIYDFKLAEVILKG
jgi:N-acylneuraminate cytidylyltransferase